MDKISAQSDVVYWSYIPNDACFPEILGLSNIFGFSAVNWAPKLTKTVNFVCIPFEPKLKLLKDYSNTMFALLEDYLWSKLTTDIYLNKVFHLTKSRGVKMSLKIRFLAQFWSFLNTAISCGIYDASSCFHHWSNVQTKLTTFREFWPIDNLKLAWNDSFYCYKNIWKFIPP